MAAPTLPRGLLDRFSLVTRARGAQAGERAAREAGGSVEFLDYRPYQPGDEPRAVDWRAYARSGRLYTRLYQADRAAEVHLVLDTSASMRLHGKRRFAAAAARLLAYLSGQEASGRIHLLDGRASAPARTAAERTRLWRFLNEAPEVASPAEDSLAAALTKLVLGLPAHRGAALLVVLSDLLDPAPLRPLLTALRARRTDALFVQVLARTELDPPLGAFELRDVEGGENLEVGPEEARAYRDAVLRFVQRVRGEIAAAGARHVLLQVPEGTTGSGAGEAELERAALAALLGAGAITRR